MSKVFRLYKEGSATIREWNESPAFPYNSNARDTIEDPDGASAKNEITSIPSPFARIDLVKTAFKEVCRRAKRDIKELEAQHHFPQDGVGFFRRWRNLFQYRQVQGQD